MQRDPREFRTTPESTEGPNGKGITVCSCRCSKRCHTQLQPPSTLNKCSPRNTFRNIPQTLTRWTIHSCWMSLITSGAFWKCLQNMNQQSIYHKTSKYRTHSLALCQLGLQENNVVVVVAAAAKCFVLSHQAAGEIILTEPVTSQKPAGFYLNSISLF